jgi:hypothetical protein
MLSNCLYKIFDYLILLLVSSIVELDLDIELTSLNRIRVHYIAKRRRESDILVATRSSEEALQTHKEPASSGGRVPQPFLSFLSHAR